MNFSYFPYDVWHGSTYNIMSAPHFSQSYFYRWCSFGFHINLCKYLDKYDHTISNVPIFWRPTFQVYKVRYWIRDTQSLSDSESHLFLPNPIWLWKPTCKFTWNPSSKFTWNPAVNLHGMCSSRNWDSGIHTEQMTVEENVNWFVLEGVYWEGAEEMNAALENSNCSLSCHTDMWTDVNLE